MNNLNGTHSIDKFIESALYDKNYGYYSKKNPFGKKGDFVTAPNISKIFCEMIVIWLVSFWESLNKPKKLSLKTTNFKRGTDLNRKAFEKIIKNYTIIKQRIENEK